MKPETPAHAAQRAEIAALMDAHGLGARRDALLGMVRPAIGLRTREATAADLAPGATRVGGTPDLPEDAAWPEGEEGPLSFVLQVRLADVTALDLEGLLPDEGTLWVFADRFAQDVRVTWAPPDAVLTPRVWTGDPRGAFLACGVDVEAELHLPHPASAFLEGDDSPVQLSGDEHDAYWDDVWLVWWERLRPGAAGSVGIHQLLGYAAAENLEEQGRDEIVVVGFDSDDRARMQWGDVHTVWVLLDAEGLAARSWSRARAAM